jgi:hypothetical protein
MGHSRGRANSKSGHVRYAAENRSKFRALTASRGRNIPPKRNRNEPICFSPYLYRARNLVERFFNKIKQCRRVATRYDKLSANYLAFIKLASIRIWLRANESTPWYLVSEKCGVVLGVGIGELQGQAFRIAHMGHINAPMILGTLGVIEVGLNALKIPHGKGGTEAAIEWLGESAGA